MSYKHLNFCENIFKSRVIIKFAELTSTFLLLPSMALKIIKLKQMNSWADYLWNEFQKIFNFKNFSGGVAENNLKFQVKLESKFWGYEILLPQ